MSIEEILQLKNKIGRELCDRERQINTMGYVSGRTDNNIRRWNKQYYNETGKTIRLENGNIIINQYRKI